MGKLLTAVVIFALAEPARAGDYTFDIPQLLGHYLGDIPAVPTIEVEIDLGMEFAQIDGVSLQLAGTHTPGLAGDLNSPQTIPFPAEVTARSERPGLFSDVYIDELLPLEAGPFDLSAPFRVGHFAPGPPDFSPWLSGTAEFEFSVHTPPMLAIYYLIEMPSVTITSATLVVHGQPNLDEFMLRGDFDGNGLIDGKDLLAWQRNPSVGALADWQESFGTDSLAAVSVPEPSCLALALGIFLACRSRSRQTLDRG